MAAAAETPGRKMKSGFLLHHCWARLVWETPSALVSQLENGDTARPFTLFVRALHFAPPSRPLALSRDATGLPLPFHAGVRASGRASAEGAGGGGSPHPREPRLGEGVRTAREKDQRTLTKQPTCKLMERKLKLLQVLRECTAVGRQAVVCGAGARLASPLASVFPLWEEPSEVPGFPAMVRSGCQACLGVPVSETERKSA